MNLGLFPVYFEELLAVVRKNPFAMIIDEYTDISNKKLLGVVFRINKGGKVGSALFDLIEIVESDANTIFNILD